MTKWLDLAEAEIGTHEVAGSADNPRILAYYRDAGHAGIEHDETPWCAAFVCAMLKRAGYPHTRSLAARSFTTYGTKLDRPQLGCIVVMTRGASTWEGHVGFFVGETATHVKVLGGNQRDSVSIASFPKSSVLAYRMPVAATVKALRNAGSTEIAAADTAQKVAVGTATTTAAAAATAPSAPEPPPIIPPIDPAITDAVQYVTVGQQAGEAINVVLDLARTHWWVLALLACAAVYLLARWIKHKRVARAASGLPLSAQLEEQEA